MFIVLSAAQAQDIFKKYGHNKEMLTLSKGKYEEIFKNEEIVQIGTVLINTKTNKIVQLLEADTTKTNYTAELSSRFLTVDPLAEEYYSYSPYAYVMNNPVIYTDPTGEFVTRVGAWIYSIFNGGGEIHRDSGGEYFVSQKVEYSGEEGGAAVSRTFDWKGRSTGKDLALESSKEVFVSDMKFQQLCEQHGMEYVRYDNRSDAIAGMLQPASMVVLPNPIVRTATSAVNNSKILNVSKVEIKFGRTENQIYHAFRHTDKMGLSRTAVQSAVEAHVKPLVSNISMGKPFNQIIQVAGQKIQYTAFKLSDGSINIGRIHGVN